MSFRNRNRKGKDTNSAEQDLFADELAASLNRQISGEEEISSDVLTENRRDAASSIEDDLSDVFDQAEEKEEDPENLIHELQMAVDDELASSEKQEVPEKDLLDDLEEEEIEEEEPEKEPAEEAEPVSKEEIPEEGTAVKAAEAGEEALDEPDEAEEEALDEPDEAEEEALDEPDEVEEEALDEPDDSEEEALDEPDDSEEEALDEPDDSEEEALDEPDDSEEEGLDKPDDSEEEAFDKADTGILDVSAGVAGMDDLPSEPAATAAAPRLSRREQKKLDKVQAKEDKRRLKQEAAEAKEREKQEAAEAREREKQEAKDLKRQKKEEKKAGKKKGAGKIILLLLLLLIAAAAVVYLALSNRYKTVFFDGTVINGADCTGLTVSEAETVIEHQMDDYELTLVFRDGQTETISGDSIGFSYASDGSVQDILDSQVPVMWLSAFFEEYSYEATTAAEYDTQLVSDVVTALEEANIANMTAPADAYLQYNAETNALEIVPETQGNSFDLSDLIEAVNEAVSTGTTELNLEEQGLYAEPSRTSEDEELTALRDSLNETISASITYTLPTDEEKVLDADTLVTWLAVDESGNYYYDEENWNTNLGFFVEDLAREVNTSETTADFTTQSGSVVSLDNYLQGWVVDEETEEAQLAQELAAHTVTVREPVYSQRAYSEENNGIGTTYVEVDLSAQHLWVVENGVVILESDVVSGMMTTSRYTPEGIYPLYGKQEGRYLRGTQYSDGTYEYETWVNYWMPFNGGIGLHDASWRTEFGGTTYIGGGSHGCINLPSDTAAEIFEWITTGTPVICYYSAGYTVAADGTYGEE